MLNQVIVLNEPHEQPHPAGPQRSREQLTKFFSENRRFSGGGVSLTRELASPCLKQSDHREARASQTLRISLSRAGDTGIGGSPRCSSVIALE